MHPTENRKPIAQFILALFVGFLLAALPVSAEEMQIYEWVIGVDVTGDGAHAQHAVTTGGVTLVVTDPEGNFAWQLIDPMYWDEGLIRNVLERLYGG